ncbi:hypothetical protein KUTeg_001342, partial [Tegillarca granosa]
MHTLVKVVIFQGYILTQVLSWVTWNSTCYYFSSDTLGYALASEACRDSYSQLVEIESTLEHAELVKYMSAGKHYWAGIQRNSNKEHYWVHGGGIVQRELWVSYAPNDDVDCARFRDDNGRKLDDRTCTEPYNYICEKAEDENANYFCDGNQQLTGNVAMGKSSLAYASNTNAGLIVDGDNSTCASTKSGIEAWWQVDLGEHHLVNNVVLTSSEGEELKDLEIILYSIDPSVYGDDANYTVCALFLGPVNGTSIDNKCSVGTAGRWLRIVKTSNTKLILCEIEVYVAACFMIQNSSTCQKPIITYNITTVPSTSDITSTQYQISTGSTYSLTDTTTLVAMTTEAETTENVSTECFCPCSNMQNSNISEKELAEFIDKIKKELTVDSKTTNAYIRTLTSADDHRPSARGVGSLGLVLLVVTLLFFVSGDIIHVVAHLVSKIRIMKKRKHYGKETLRYEIIEKVTLRYEIIEKETLRYEFKEKETLRKETLRYEIIEKETLRYEIKEKENYGKETLRYEIIEKEMLQYEIIGKGILRYEIIGR